MQAQFCEHLARHGNVRLACRAAGVSAQTAYRMRCASAQFRALWDAALVIARDQVEDVLADRAVHGWDEAVFYHGEEVARRRRYDSRLLLAHLARLDKLAERAAGGVVARFDEALDVLSADEELVLADAEAAVVSVLRERSCRTATPAQDERDQAPVPPQAEDERDLEEGTPLLEAQLCWLEEQYGALSEEEEVFHLLHTVPGVPGSEFRRFGWRGGASNPNGDLARDQARDPARELDGSVDPGARPELCLRVPPQVSSAAARC